MGTISKGYRTIAKNRAQAERTARATAGNRGGSKAAYSKAADEARAANEKRYSQGIGMLDETISRYQPGGDFGKGAMAQYERGKTRALSDASQSLVSSGLSNTTVAASIGKKYEEEVGTSFRLQLEDMRMGRLQEAEMAKVGFMERRTDAYPDASLMAQAAEGAASGPSSSGGGGGPTVFGDSFKTKKMQTTGGQRTPGVYGSKRNKGPAKPTYLTTGAAGSGVKKMMGTGGSAGFSPAKAKKKTAKKKQAALLGGTTYQPQMMSH